MKSRLVFTALTVTLGLVAIASWRRNRRVGTRLVNRVVNPFLLREGLTGGSHSELGTIEHVGRATGIVRRTPVRPVPTSGGFRIVVPLAEDSQWARNVIAAGRCRLQWHETVYELDEPRLVAPSECADLGQAVRLLTSALGIRYMRLHRFSAYPGSLSSVGARANYEDSEPVGHELDLAGVG